MICQRALLNALKMALDGFEEAEDWQDTIHRASLKNRWFEPQTIVQALKQWRISLDDYAVDRFLHQYSWPVLRDLEDSIADSNRKLDDGTFSISETSINNPVNPNLEFSSLNRKKLGLILAGNIPLVGLQDVINGVLAGYTLKVKRSSDDEVLIDFLISKAATYDPRWKQRIEWSEDMKGIDAAIATGSNNSSRYFEYYFRNIPHIIRKNRNSAAWVSGHESEDQLEKLGNDVFDYFGLGCRNVTHLILPPNYDLGRIFKIWDTVYLDTLVNHNKYVNNYHYHKALLLMNLDPHVDTGYVIAKENNELYAPVGMLHYSFIENFESGLDKIQQWGDAIQVLAVNDETMRKQLLDKGIACVDFGETQCTTLDDYADNIDTVSWLLSINAVKTL